MKKAWKVGLLAGAATTVISVGLYASPYIAINSMRAALHERDAKRLASYVDFEALKEDLKTTLIAKMYESSRASGASESTTMATGALAGAFIAPVVDQMVKPENLTAYMTGANPGQDQEAQKIADAPVDTQVQYRSVGEVTLSIHRQGSAAKPIVLVMHRQGLFFWRLVALRFDS